MPASVRTRAFGFQMICIHLFGDAISPILVGYVSDALHSLRLAISLAPISILCGSIIFGIGWKFFDERSTVNNFSTIVGQEEVYSQVDSSGRVFNSTADISIVDDEISTEQLEILRQSVTHNTNHNNSVDLVTLGNKHLSHSTLSKGNLVSRNGLNPTFNPKFDSKPYPLFIHHDEDDENQNNYNVDEASEEEVVVGEANENIPSSDDQADNATDVEDINPYTIP
eukprot:TRINITY_DN4007_c0_g1_i15.p2 TRINITY_DN4007_c0_g1~~TRINITY_DN4007_c0_g1_i15.p2  ORF type:complete len:225 (-),score=48.12 TRINITY_DN4007_c0_g1_i15:435-1109(-)